MRRAVDFEISNSRIFVRPPSLFISRIDKSRAEELMSPVSPGPGLSTPEGLRLARQLLRPQLLHDIHDHILQGICQAIDSEHVLSVTPTARGKTGYFYGYILLL